MAEDFSLSELIIPGTYIRVRPEGLVGVGGIATGNIGIVGTSAQGQGSTAILSSYQDAAAAFGGHTTADFGYAHALDLLYQAGAGTVYARSLDPDPNKSDATAYTGAFNELLKENVNILVAPQLTTANALAVFGGVLTEADKSHRDVMVVVGSDATKVADIKGQSAGNGRIVLAAPGYKIPTGTTWTNTPGPFVALPVAALLGSLTPQTSPTNKAVPGLVYLNQRFSYAETKDLLGSGILVLEERQGVRVVRGISTDVTNTGGHGPFFQITTRRITDFAKAGIRQAADPFIGRLNNARVRKALQGAINGFLTTMVQDEALIGYTLDVSATRDDEINGRAIVNCVLQPTFSIDFVAVTLTLQ